MPCCPGISSAQRRLASLPELPPVKPANPRRSPDAYASALRSAVEIKPDGTISAGYALNLIPRLGLDRNGRIANYGIKVMPSPLWKAGLIDPQIEFFERLG